MEWTRTNRWGSAEDPSPPGVGWRGAVVVLGSLLLVFAYRGLASFGPQFGFSKDVEYWLFRPTDSSPIVILVLALWLLYRRRDRIRALQPSATGSVALALPPLLTGIGVYAWAIHTSARDLQLISLVLECAALVLLYWGREGLRALWLPAIFPLFAMPLPAPLLLAVIFKLQLWTASWAGWILHVLGMPALVSGDQIIRVHQSFQVIEGCSGMRSIQTLSMLTVLLIDLFRRRGWPALLLFVIAPLLAFALNGFRVVTLILNPSSEIIAIHNLQGLAILLAGLLIIYAIDGYLERYAVSARTAPLASPRSARPPAPSRRGFGDFAPVALALSLLSVAYATPVWQEPESESISLYDLVSEALGRWPSGKLEEDFFFRGSARFGQVVHRRYELEQGPVSVFLATADLGQRGGSPLSRVTEVPGTGWAVLERRPVALEPAQPGATSLLLAKGRHRVLAYHWFHGARGLATETLRSFLALDRSELRRIEKLYVARLDTPVIESGQVGLEAARSRLEQVDAALQPVLAAVGGKAGRL